MPGIDQKITIHTEAKSNEETIKNSSVLTVQVFDRRKYLDIHKRLFDYLLAYLHLNNLTMNYDPPPPLDYISNNKLLIILLKR